MWIWLEFLEQLCTNQFQLWKAKQVDFKSENFFNVKMVAYKTIELRDQDQSSISLPNSYKFFLKLSSKQGEYFFMFDFSIVTA